MATIVVNDGGDTVDANDNVVTLREALQAANTNAVAGNASAGEAAPVVDVIKFAPNVTGTIELLQANGSFQISETVTIEGPGAGRLSIDAGGNDFRVVNVTATAGDVTISGLTITGGKTTGDDSPGETTHHGGGIRSVSNGTLTIQSSVITGNRTEGQGAFGGGLAVSSGRLVLRDSTVSNNSALGTLADGGGVAANVETSIINSTISGNTAGGSGGGIQAGSEELVVTNSTISGNSSVGDGGGIDMNPDDDTSTITGSTITGNTADGEGGGIHFVGTLTVVNSIVAGNFSTAFPDISQNGFINSANTLVGTNLGTTLVEAQTADAFGMLVGGPTPETFIDPSLGPLTFNGGPTKTHALMIGSKAIDAGNNGFDLGTPNDQRGKSFARRFDAGIGTARVDMGAFELQTVPLSLVVDLAIDEFDADFSQGDRSLREAIALANASLGADTITFAESVTPLHFDFVGPEPDFASLGGLVISDSLTISNPSTELIELHIKENPDKPQDFPIFEITETAADVAFIGLTLQRWEDPGEGSSVRAVANGAAIQFDSDGDLELTNVVIEDSNAIEKGGAIFSSNGGTIRLNNSVLQRNSAGDGGAIYAIGGTIVINNSTLSGNSALASGGAIQALGAELRVSNSTISGNTAGSGSGGGIAISGETLTINNSTVAGNIGGVSGGGLLVGDSATLHAASTIFADNTSATGPDVFGAFASANNNLLENAAGATGIADADAGENIVGQDPRLGPLRTNGSRLVQSHALLVGSPAINKGSNTDGLTFDQRGEGLERDVDVTDIGAYEVQPLTLRSITLNGDPLPDGAVLEPIRDQTISFVAEFDGVLADVDDNDLQFVDTNSATAIPVTITGQTNEFGVATLKFATSAIVTEGAYRLTMDSGNNTFESVAGVDLDGDPLGSNPSGTPTGDGTAGGDYTVNFVIDPAAAIPLVLRRVRPLGSLISLAELTGHGLHAANDADTFTLDANADQTILLRVIPHADANLTMTLSGPDGLIATGATDGTGASLISLATLPSDGTFTVEVTGDAPTGYTLDVLLNATSESIAEGGDTADGNELAIDQSLLNLSSGRFAVVGRSAPGANVTEPFNNSPVTIDADNLDPANNWSRPNLTGPSIATEVSQYHVQPFAVDRGGTYDITSVQTYDGYLHLYQNVFDPLDPLAGLIAANDDDASLGSSAIRVSLARGTTYFLVTSAFNDETGTFTNTISGPGRIALGTRSDEYTIDLTGEAGRPIDIVLAGHGGRNFGGESLELLDVDGTTVLATATSVPLGGDVTNYDLGILDFVVPADGVYTVRFIAETTGDYSLVVTDQLSFDTQPNDDPVGDDLRDLSGTRDALGFLVADNTFFSADFTDDGRPSLDGFTIGDEAGNLWHLSTGRSGDANHSSPDSVYFGQDEGPAGGGTYGNDIRGSLTSPDIDLSFAATAVLNFQYLLGTDSRDDTASVRISTDGGTTFDEVVSRLPGTDGAFVTYEVDLTPYLGSSVQIQFLFDSDPFETNEGWYLDDLVVRSVPDVQDHYVVDINVDDVVTVSAQSLFDLDTAIVRSNLDAALTVLGPDGSTVVAMDQDSADGKNPILSFIAPATGQYTIRVEAESGLGEYLLRLIDTTEPVVTAPAPITLKADSVDGAPATNPAIVDFLAAATATDDVDQSVAITNDAPTVFPIGDTTVTFTGTDDAGNLGTATATVTVTAAFDFGDAPAAADTGFANDYPVTVAQDGASHLVGSLFLGDSIDAEADGQPDAAAGQDASGGDDNNGDADEDGVFVLANLVSISGTETTSSYQVFASQAGKLDAWIDFNQNGLWEAAEKIFDNVDLAVGSNVLSYSIADGAAIGETGARFRLSTAGDLDPTGSAADGEVEDYIANIEDGSTSPDVSVKLVDSVATLIAVDGKIVVRGDAVDLFGVPIDRLGKLDIAGDETDNVITLDVSGGNVIPPGGLGVDGGGGSNALRVLGGDSDLDFTEDGDIAARNFAGIDLSGSGQNRITLDAASVAAMSPAATLVVLGGDGDTIVFQDADDWRMGATSIVDGRFVRAVDNIAGGGESIDTELGKSWQNVIRVSDVNNNGQVTAGDALVVIAELGRRAFSNRNSQVLDDPLTVEVWPDIYFDQNGDGKATALDALRVINEVGRLQGRAPVSGESEAIATPFVAAKREGLNLPIQTAGTVNAEPREKASCFTVPASVAGGVELTEFDFAEQSETTTGAVDELLADETFIQSLE